jgi:hypothetical protein
MSTLSSKPISPRSGGRRAAWIIAVASFAGACVFGFRGDADFAGEASLADVDTVVLELPPTDLVLAGEASRAFLDWQGTWVSIGGSSADALAAARAPELRWESFQSVGRLTAQVDLALRDITSLEHLDVQSATYLAHEIIGSGDVFVTGIDAYVSVTLDGGNIRILGGVEQLHVSTQRGDIDLTTSAAVDAHSGAGSVTVRAEVSRNIEIDTLGQVRVELPDASNVDIDIEGAGQVTVQLDDVAHIGSGSYRRVIGLGTHTLHIRSNGGAVDVGMLLGSE